jgi:putative hydrolase of the HAD superfamily
MQAGDRVFFDAAGTLFESREPVARSYARIAQRYGLNASEKAVAERFRTVFHATPGIAFGPGRPADELRRLEREWWRDVVSRTFAGLGEFDDFDSYFTELFGFFADPANWRADAEAVPLLRTLRSQGVKLGIISNFDYRLYRILEGLELAPWFDSVTISSEAGYAKPAPELFAVALGKHGASGPRSVHVGDSESHDVAGARAAGLAAVFVDRRWRGGIALADGFARVGSLSAVAEAARALCRKACGADAC